MGDFEHRQDVGKLSIASIARLEALLRSLRAASDLPYRALPELERRSQLLRSLQLREHDCLNQVIIGSQPSDAGRELVDAIEDAVQRISDHLGGDWRRQRVSEHESNDRFESPVWAIGSVIYIVEHYPILRGEIELLRTVPIAAGIPEVVVELLLAVPGTENWITRENHGHWGYHYHYLDSKDRRSDTLLTFDRKSVSAALPTLCWERHAEGGKFKARAGTWGSDKRKSVYFACHPDALRFNLSNFKRPASDAEVVWP